MKEKNEVNYKKCHNCAYAEEYYTLGDGLHILCKITGEISSTIIDCIKEDKNE